MSAGLTAEERIHYSHLDRLGPDCIDDIRPPIPGNPMITVGIERTKPQQAFGGNCSAQQMSQICPYLSQMGPKTSTAASPDWRCPPTISHNATLKGTLHVSLQDLRFGTRLDRVCRPEHRLHP